MIIFGSKDKYSIVIALLKKSQRQANFFGRLYMNVTKWVVLYLLGLSLILLTGNFPLWGGEDHLAKFGVIRLDKRIDAPEFILPDLKGTKRSLSEFRGKFIMLNFWATW